MCVCVCVCLLQAPQARHPTLRTGSGQASNRLHRPNQTGLLQAAQARHPTARVRGVGIPRRARARGRARPRTGFHRPGIPRRVWGKASHKQLNVSRRVGPLTDSTGQAPQAVTGPASHGVRGVRPDSTDPTSHGARVGWGQAQARHAMAPLTGATSGPTGPTGPRAVGPGPATSPASRRASNKRHRPSNLRATTFGDDGGSRHPDAGKVRC